VDGINNSESGKSIISGLAIAVEPIPSGEGDTEPSNKATYICSPVISIYVQFETVNEDARVTEASLRSIFENFGPLTGKT
jgi:hypothetical protein